MSVVDNYLNFEHLICESSHCESIDPRYSFIPSTILTVTTPLVHLAAAIIAIAVKVFKLLFIMPNDDQQSFKERAKIFNEEVLKLAKLPWTLEAAAVQSYSNPISGSKLYKYLEEEAYGRSILGGIFDRFPHQKIEDQPLSSNTKDLLLNVPIDTFNYDDFNTIPVELDFLVWLEPIFSNRDSKNVKVSHIITNKIIESASIKATNLESWEIPKFIDEVIEKSNELSTKFKCKNYLSRNMLAISIVRTMAAYKQYDKIIEFLNTKYIESEEITKLIKEFVDSHLEEIEKFHLEPSKDSLKLILDKERLICNFFGDHKQFINIFNELVEKIKNLELDPEIFNKLIDAGVSDSVSSIAISITSLITEHPNLESATENYNFILDLLPGKIPSEELLLNRYLDELRKKIIESWAKIILLWEGAHCNFEDSQEKNFIQKFQETITLLNSKLDLQLECEIKMDNSQDDLLTALATFFDSHKLPRIKAWVDQNPTNEDYLDWLQNHAPLGYEPNDCDELYNIYLQTIIK